METKVGEKLKLGLRVVAELLMRRKKWKWLGRAFGYVKSKMEGYVFIGVVKRRSVFMAPLECTV